MSIAVISITVGEMNDISNFITILLNFHMDTELFLSYYVLYSSKQRKSHIDENKTRKKSHRRKLIF